MHAAFGWEDVAWAGSFGCLPCRLQLYHSTIVCSDGARGAQSSMRSLQGVPPGLALSHALVNAPALAL